MRKGTYTSPGFDIEIVRLQVEDESHFETEILPAVLELETETMSHSWYCLGNTWTAQTYMNCVTSEQEHGFVLAYHDSALCGFAFFEVELKPRAQPTSPEVDTDAEVVVNADTDTDAAMGVHADHDAEVVADIDSDAVPDAAVEVHGGVKSGTGVVDATLEASTTASSACSSTMPPQDGPIPCPTHVRTMAIAKLGVTKTMRGKHVGQRIAEELRDLCWELPVDQVTLGVHADNFVALGMYVSWGFTEDSRECGVYVTGDSINMSCPTCKLLR